MGKRLHGLFLNTKKEICSIYESGKMCFDCLAQSTNYTLDYIEIYAENREISLDYDFYLFNYHFDKMGWLDTKLIKKIPGFKATIVLEMSQNSPFDCVSPDDFDAYLVLDPTCKHFMKNVYAFSRPLEVAATVIEPYVITAIPTIGTFGLSFSDKGFDDVVKAVNEEFDAAIIKINVPDSVNVTPKVIADFNTLISGFNIKNGIKVELSNHYFTKNELINWCAQNTLNVFLYNRRIGNGLSATTDQAIASGRPLAISTNPTFRHIHTYIKPYPYLSLKESIETTITLVKKIQNDWSQLNFIQQFENVLTENSVKPIEIEIGSKTKLPLLNRPFRFVNKLLTRQVLVEFIPPILFKLRNKFRKASRNDNLDHAPSILKPFVHQILQSNSQFQEDLLIDLLFSGKQKGMYVDIGANDPFFNSNTRRFYLRGWRGINIEPGKNEFEKIATNRQFDINLNIAVSFETGKLTFYKIGNDSSLSTLDYDTAIKMAKTYNKDLITSTIDVLRLSDVFDNYLGNRNIDFMSVDAEGHDLAVLKSNNWSIYRPTIIMVESNIDSSEIIKYMDNNKYLYIYSNHVNAIFVDKMTNDQNIIDKLCWD